MKSLVFTLAPSLRISLPYFPELHSGISIHMCGLHEFYLISIIIFGGPEPKKAVELQSLGKMPWPQYFCHNVLYIEHLDWLRILTVEEEKAELQATTM